MKKVFLILLTILSATYTHAQITIDSLDIKIGQMILVGLDDRTTINSSDPLAKEIMSGKVGGILLFEKNISKVNSKSILAHLTDSLQKFATIPLLITIDEEGGLVHRMKKKYGFVDMPSAAALGNIDDPDTTYYYYKRLAAEMAFVGINLNFAPVVDVAVNPNNPPIVRVKRSFSKDPDEVTEHALACIDAHHYFGVKTILKHFPGHGSSAGDSHHGLVDVTNTWSKMEMEPYRDIIAAGKCDAVMTAHIVNKKWNSSARPATLSREVITDSLRGSLGFKGVVISDDMNMHAISEQYGYNEAIKMAINAGVDVLMFGNNIQTAQGNINATRIHQVIKSYVLKGEISRERIDESYRRIMKLKESF